MLYIVCFIIVEGTQRAVDINLFVDIVQIRDITFCVGVKGNEIIEEEVNLFVVSVAVECCGGEKAFEKDDLFAVPSKRVK